MADIMKKDTGKLAEWKTLDGQSITLSMDDVKQYFCSNATDKEIMVFLETARTWGLNPWKREVHLVKYGNSPAQIIVGYEVYLKRAERTGKLNGWKCWIEGDGPNAKAVVEIYRKDWGQPFRWEVYRAEADRGQATWKQMWRFMLRKVAIAQGFRLAFPEELGGMPYVPEEVPQEAVEVLPEPEEPDDDIPVTLEALLDQIGHLSNPLEAKKWGKGVADQVRGLPKDAQDAVRDAFRIRMEEFRDGFLQKIAEIKNIFEARNWEKKHRAEIEALPKVLQGPVWEAFSQKVKEFEEVRDG